MTPPDFATEARIGAELKAAQERGEVATRERGRPVNVRASDTFAPLTLPDLGITRQRASEMKKLADVATAARWSRDCARIGGMRHRSATPEARRWKPSGRWRGFAAPHARPMPYRPA